MGIERVLEYSIGLFKRDWRIMLPIVLEWIPTALILLLFLQAASSIGSIADFTNLQSLVTNPGILWQIISVVVLYVILAIPIFIVSVVIGSVLNCVYSDIVRQSVKRKQISLVSAFSVAGQKFLPLLGTYTLEFVVVLAGFGALLILGMLGGIIGIVIALFVAIVGVFLAVMFFYLTTPVVVLEGKSGWQAMMRSVEVGKSNFLPLIAILLVTGVVASVISSGLGNVPMVGIAVSSLAALFLESWRLMMPNIFYLEYGKKRN